MTSSVDSSPDFMGSKEFIFLDRPIATVDIETLSLKSSAVIYDVGLIVTEVLPLPGQLWSIAEMQRASQFGLCKSWSFKPSLIEQVLKNRTIDQETVDWHTKRCSKLGIDFQQMLVDNSKEEVSAKIVFEQLEQIFSIHKVNEVWMNHPQFDQARLESYFQSLGIQAMPWVYTKEFDVASIKLGYRKRIAASNEMDLTHSFVKNEADSHTGLGDCCYNLAIVSTTGTFTPLGNNINA